MDGDYDVDWYIVDGIVLIVLFFLLQFGRGGAGNMRPSSTSRGREMSQERGRETNRILPTNGIDGIDPVPEHSLP